MIKEISRLRKYPRLKGDGCFYALVRGSGIKITSKRMDAGNFPLTEQRQMIYRLDIIWSDLYTN
jgi:hypothetical protein